MYLHSFKLQATVFPHLLESVDDHHVAVACLKDDSMYVVTLLLRMPWHVHTYEHGSKGHSKISC